METFYAVNRPKDNSGNKKDVHQHCVSTFDQLNKNLDKCLEGSIINFYKPILTELEALFGEKEEDGVPSLFIQGYCVNWNWIFKKIKEQWGNTYHLCRVMPGECTLKELLSEMRTAMENGLNLIVAILQVECFARNSLLDSIIEFLADSDSKCYLMINSTIEYAAILDRISRVNFTYLNIRPLKLTPPDHLLNAVFDALLDGSALGNNRLMFSGDVLACARFRYLYEDFSLTELRKNLLFALSDYLQHCKTDTLKAIAGKKHSDADNFPNRSVYVKVMNCLLILSTNMDDTDSVEKFLEFHDKVQNEDKFLTNHLNGMKLEFSEWNKEKWIAILKKLSTQMVKCKQLASEQLKVQELLEMLSKLEQENDAAVNVEITSKRQNACAFLKNKPKLLQAARNLPSNTDMKCINDFLSAFFGKFPLKWDRKFLIELPKDKLTYLETSNIRYLDEIMNPHVDIDPHLQLDIITLYHVLVDSNSEAVSIDVTDAFEKFSACLAKSNILRTNNITAQSRFFNAIAQLEYSGIVSLSTTEKMLRLTYLPTTSAPFTDQRILF